MKDKRDSAEAGFGLIELVVGAMLLLIVMAGFLPVFLQGLNQTSSARFKSMATNIAREKIEQIRQLDYREVFEDPENPTNPRNLSVRFGTLVEVPERNMSFNVSYGVDNDVLGPGQAIKSVQVNVTWTAPPVPSPAIVKTAVAQQYLGPRGSWLEVSNTSEDKSPPPGTPFPVLTTLGPTIVKYHIASSDWFMAFDSLTLPLMAENANDISLASQFRDDLGGIVGKIDVDNSKLAWSTDENPAAVSDIRFEYPIEVGTIPDGYWDLMVTMLNIYDEPGNTWILRVRVEKGAPEAPTNFEAKGLSDTQIKLSWDPGAERDRARYVLERQKQNPDGTWPAGWTTVDANLPPDTATYTDTGVVDADPPVDPWGSSSLDPLNCYRYRIYGVDTGGLSEPDSPSHSATMSEDEGVTLPPLSPPVLVTVPLVENLTLGEAKMSLEAVLLGWSVTETPDTTRTPGTVLTQSPAAGTKVDAAAKIALTVASGTAPPSVKYTVTFTTLDNNWRTFQVMDSGNTPIPTAGRIKQHQPVVLQLGAGHYHYYVGLSMQQSFSVSGQDLSLSIP